MKAQFAPPQHLGALAPLRYWRHAVAGEGRETEPHRTGRDWKLTSGAAAQSEGAALSVAGYRDARWHPIHRMPATVLEILQEDGVYTNLFLERTCWRRSRRTYTGRTGGIGSASKRPSASSTRWNFPASTTALKSGLTDRRSPSASTTFLLSFLEIAATSALGPDQLLSTNPPQLSLALKGTNLLISWPLANAGFTLQSQTNLASGNWVNMMSPARHIAGNQWQVALPLPAGTNSVFYRLIK